MSEKDLYDIIEKYLKGELQGEEQRASFYARATRRWRERERARDLGSRAPP